MTPVTDTAFIERYTRAPARTHIRPIMLACVTAVIVALSSNQVEPFRPFLPCLFARVTAPCSRYGVVLAPKDLAATAASEVL